MDASFPTAIHHDNTSSVSSKPPPSPSSAEPVTVAFTIGNTYRRLSDGEAKYDKLTGRHLKIHDWTLYVDVLPGYDADIIDRVTFDMRDDSCECLLSQSNTFKCI